LESKQGSSLSRRVVHLITQYLEPKEIFELITKKQYDYSVLIQSEYGCRDRAMMALCFVSAGRISEVVGGPRFQTEKIEGKRIVKKVGKHPGLQAENFVVNENYITVSGMKVVKRSQKLLIKYGDQIAIRDDFVIPLKRGLFSNAFWDQLVPFGWLILEYLTAHAPKRGKLFPYEDTRAYQIVREMTGMFPHWFRAQAEQFYGHFLLTDSIKLAKFVKIQDVQHVKHYIGYDWKEQLKDTSLSLDFKWIEGAVLDIQKRIGTQEHKVSRRDTFPDSNVLGVDVSKEQGFQQQNAIPFQKPSIEKAFAHPQECAEGPSLSSLRSTALQQVPNEEHRLRIASQSPIETHVNKASQVKEETLLEHGVKTETVYNEPGNAKLGSGEASQSQTCKFYSFSRGLVECKSKFAEENVIFRGTQEVCDACWNDPRCPGRRTEHHTKTSSEDVEKE